MSLAWNAWALLGFVPGVVCCALAILIYRAAPAKPANRRLSVVIFLYGTLFAWESGFARLATDPRDAFAFVVVGDAAVLALLPCYLLFLATLDTPLVRPLRMRAGTAALVLLAIVPTLLFVLRPAALYPGVTPGSLWPWAGIDGPLYPAYRYYQFGVIIFSFLLALDAWRRAPHGTVARTRSKAYALCFGAHDALWIVEYVIVVIILGDVPAGFWAIEFTVFRAVVPTAFALGLAYSMLRWHLFDLDLKIKRGVSKGTVVAAFLVAFVVIAEVAQNWLSDTQGYMIGGVSAAILVLAIRPLERFADRLASAAMPGVTGSSEYVAYRKLQVYRATLEGAREDGVINERERAMLDALARELGIRPEDARAVEAEVARA